MPAKKKSRVETPKATTIWQVLIGNSHYANLDAETIAALEKARESKIPNHIINVANVPHAFDLQKNEMVDTGLAATGTTAQPLKIRRLPEGATWLYPDDNGIYVGLYDEDNALIEQAWRLHTTNPDPNPKPFQTKDLSWNKGYDTLYTYTFSAQTVYPPTAQQKNEDSGRVRMFKREEAAQQNVLWDTKTYGIANMALPTVISVDPSAATAAPASAPTATADGSSAAAPAAIATEDAAASVTPAPAPAKAPATAVVTEAMLKTPETWEPQTLPFQRFTLAEGSDEYTSIAKPFLTKLKNNKATIMKIERLQNSMLWKFYALTRYRIAMRNKGNPNEMLLYHGARVRDNMDAIMNFGFDMRVAANGLAGVGIYFAVHSSYSNCGYVLYDPNTKTKEMFVCRVTVGSCTKGKMGLVRPPPKSNKKADQGDLYDSVHNNTDVMFVVFDNTQAYPEYLITYKENNG